MVNNCFRDPSSGQGVVATVSCMRMHRRDSESETNENTPTCSKRLKLDASASHTSCSSATGSSRFDGMRNERKMNDHEHFVKEIRQGNSTKLERTNLTLQRQSLRRSIGNQTNIDEISASGVSHDGTDEEEEGVENKEEIGQENRSMESRVENEPRTTEDEGKNDEEKSINTHNRTDDGDRETVN